MNRQLIHFIAALSGSAILVACGNNKEQQAQQAPGSQAISVSIETVQEEIATGITNYPGTVVPLNQTELRAEVNGYITGVFVSDGASVNKGQKLYEIDRTRYQSAYEQAKAQLDIAQSNYDKVNRDLDRYKKLSEQDAIAKQTLDYAMTDLSNAQAQVSSAKAALNTAATDLNRSTIVAPFSGTIGISQVRQGALVSAGTTLINTLSSTNPIAVDFYISESNIQNFVSMMNNRSKTLADSTIKIQMANQSTYHKPGYISAIDRAVDPTTGTIAVRASFDNGDGALRAGMNTNVLIASKSTTKLPIIPYKAVMEQLGEFNVFTVSDSSTAVIRPVKLGQKIADKIAIISGINAGDKLIVDGVQNVQNGAKVADQQASPAAATNAGTTK